MKMNVVRAQLPCNIAWKIRNRILLKDTKY